MAMKHVLSYEYILKLNLFMVYINSNTLFFNEFRTLTMHLLLLKQSKYESDKCFQTV